jgi:hypothetical protein
LNDRLARSEVLNFGVGMYGADQSWLLYQRTHATWNPCAVLIGHQVMNVHTVVNRFRMFIFPTQPTPLPKPRFILTADGLTLIPNPVQHPDQMKDPAWVETNLGANDFWYFPGLFVPQPLDRVQAVRLMRSLPYRAARRLKREALYEQQREHFEILSLILVSFAQQVRSDGSTPVVVLFPSHSEIIDQRAGRPRIHAPLLATLARHGIATIDLTDAFGEVARSHAVDELVKGHYRPFGNTVVADVLAQRLPPLIAATCGSG